MPRAVLCTVAALLCVLTGCTRGISPGQVEVTTTPPKLGACRVLTPSDVARPTNDTGAVPCSKPHTAQTYLIDSFKGSLATAAYDDARLGARAYRTCSTGFRTFTGADESLVLRTVLTWAWFRPSEAAWKAGARWYRCDVVGGSDRSSRLTALPRTAKGLLLGIPGDAWMSCVAGGTVTGAVPVACTEKHQWRAVTTVVVGKPGEKYPGDRLVEVQSRDYCRSSVGAWMNYPINYRFAYTWRGRAAWEAGDRRAVCWAGTSQ